jgi:hypothetical protein
LDPTAFQAPQTRRSLGAQAASRGGGQAAARMQHQQGSGSGHLGPGSGPHGQLGLQVEVVEERLGDLSVGGRLWQWPQCLVQLPRMLPKSGDVGGWEGRRGVEGGEQGREVVVSGSIAEVADAAAQLWLCGIVQHVVLGA